MTKDILILSPHMDDAVLSCCNHIRLWQRQGYNVNVLTLFSAYEGGGVSLEQEKIMHENHVGTLKNYEKVRKSEDENAMHAVNVAFCYLGFLDAGFREKNGELMYPSYADLTGELDWALESDLVKAITAKLNEYHFNGKVILPLCVGSHIDHRLARMCGEQVFANNKIGYYVDFPYARNPLKWTYRQFIDFLTFKHSIKMMDQRKREILNYYKSQVKYFFKYKPVYPEIILYK